MNSNLKLSSNEIHQRYTIRLLAYIRRRIGSRLRRRIDAEDVVQSAYRSFFVQSRVGRYTFQHPGDLWRVLIGIAKNKLAGQIERHRAERRSIDREANLSPLAEPIDAFTRTASTYAQVNEGFAEAMAQLTKIEQSVLLLTVKGQSRSSIAKSLGKSPRTIRRLLARCQHLVAHQIAGQTSRQCTNLSAFGGDLTPLDYHDYTLEQMIGAGGMGKVFRARSKQTNGLVAIKALHKSRQTDARAVERFVQEAQILQTLSHPNIVAMHGLGRFPSGGHFLVMDHFEEGDLDSRLVANSLDRKLVFRLFRQVVEAVAYAHRHGIVHCDLKPANILVEDNDCVVVTDFGFAYLLRPALDSYQSIGGTTGYLAPELLAPGTTPTPAADIYSLGALLIAMLRGTPPHPQLAKLAGHCLATNPRQRFPNGDAMLRALQLHAKSEKSPHSV